MRMLNVNDFLSNNVIINHFTWFGFNWSVLENTISVAFYILSLTLTKLLTFDSIFIYIYNIYMPLIWYQN